MNEKKRLEVISKFYGAAIVIYIILGVAAFKFMNQSTFQVSSSYLSANPLLSQHNTVFAQATHVLFTVQYRWALVVLMIVSIIVPAVYVYLMNGKNKKVNLHRYRHADWLVTGTLILLLISVLNGVGDVMTLFLIACLSVISYRLIWYATNNPQRKYIALVGGISGILPWIVIIFYAISTIVNGAVRSPWYVYILGLLGLINTAVVIYGYFWHKSRASKKVQLTDETYPISINLVIKFLFAVMLIIGLKH